MGKLLLVGRLAARDLRHRWAQAALLLLAITAATATLTLGLALHGVTNQPYQQTRAATNGPDVVAQLGSPRPAPHGPGQATKSPVAAQVKALVHASGVIGHSGPYPVASALLRARGHTAGVEAEGRGQPAALLDQPKLTAGSWVSNGGVVLERTLAEALGVSVGDRITLNGRPYAVAGIAVTAAEPPYPNLCDIEGGGCAFALQGNLLINPGLAWVTEPDARALASAGAPLSYFLNLRLRDPATATAFANAYNNASSVPGHPYLHADAPYLIPWPSIAAADGLLVQDEQSVLSPGAWLAGLLALASVAVLAGGRMAERTRRVGLLKAVGGTPGLVAVILLAENLVLALAAAAAGLVIGWLAAPLITSPGPAWSGRPARHHSPCLAPGWWWRSPSWSPWPRRRYPPSAPPAPARSARWPTRPAGRGAGPRRSESPGGCRCRCCWDCGWPPAGRAAPCWARSASPSRPWASSPYSLSTPPPTTDSWGRAGWAIRYSAGMSRC